MEHRTYYYARVSTKEQNLDRQLAAFRSLGASEREIITDKESGKDLDRKGYQALKSTILRSGDTLVIKSLDRLSRNKQDIHNELQFFKDNGIRLKVIDLPTTMMDLPEGQEWVFEMVNNILIEVLGTIAQQERTTIRQRQREGIEAARSKGKHLGRPPLQTPENWNEVYAQWQGGKITAKRAMELTGLKRSSFYRLVKGGTAICCSSFDYFLMFLVLNCRRFVPKNPLLRCGEEVLLSVTYIVPSCRNVTT